MKKICDILTNHNKGDVMKLSLHFYIGMVGALAVTGTATAQTPAPTAPVALVPATTPQAPAIAPVALPAAAAPAASSTAPNILRQGTQIRFTVVTPVNTKEHKVGKRVELQTADDILVNNKVVLPKGTPAFGELTLSKKSGSFGKAGKMAGRVLYVKNGNENIPITGTFDDRGKSGTGATVGVAVLAGVFSAFVKGKNAVLEAGTEIMGTVERDTSF
jgi:hypothetical protein